MLDTGATISGIKHASAAQLGLRSIGKRRTGSIHGEAYVDHFVFRVGFPIPPDSDSQAPRFPYMFDEVEGFALSATASFDALIGMDVLQHCDLHLDRSGKGALLFGQ